MTHDETAPAALAQPPPPPASMAQPPPLPASTLTTAQPPPLTASELTTEQPPTAPILLSSSDSGSESDYSCVLSVPPLPPQIDFSVSPIRPPQPTFDSLTLEMEVEELKDRVCSIEANQRNILLKQDEIIARLVSLEKRSLASTPHRTPYGFNEASTMDSFSFTSDHSSIYIPPPPSHPPHRFNQTPSREPHANCNTFVDGAPRSRFVLGNAAETCTPSRVPFRPLNTNNTHIDDCLPPAPQSNQVQPLRVKANKPLPSSVINKQKLVTVNEVLMKHPKLRCASKVGTLAVKLSKDAFFGQDVMAQCTVAGERDLPGLPAEELQQLKNALFMQFPEHWKTPHEFEPLWKNATESIGQACKRFRRSKL